MLRYSALTFALLALSGQVLSGLHFLLVNHITCAEHGELVETGSTLEHSTPGSNTNSIRAGDLGGHGHDHCVIALLRRQRVRQSAPRIAPLRATPTRGSLLARASSPAFKPIDVLSIAPKNSPPV